MTAIPGVRLTSFLVKIASRCNLACDYCYMYEHADQDWRNQPALMSESTRRLLAERLAQYVLEADLPEIVVLFHGGEPLLAGASCLAETAQWIRAAIRPSTRVSFSVQTNGTLLDEEGVQILSAADIGVSLSIDGGARANDLHRLDHAGRSSFASSIRGLELLERHPKVYAGLISVVDPRVPAQELFEFIAPRKPPRWDLLLPDAHHERRPPGRDEDSGLYTRWLLRAFDVWFDKYADVAVRTFDAILAACAGLRSETDAFGFGEPTLLTIETDGSLHDLDVLKITKPGATSLGYHLLRHTIAEAAKAKQFQLHRNLLTPEGLADDCRTCPEMSICGGGSVPHRYSSAGFRNPTVYCAEMLSLIRHARKRMEETLAREALANTDVRPAAVTDLERWERAESSAPWLDAHLNAWAEDVAPEWEQALGHVAQRHAELADDVTKLRSLDHSRKRSLTIQPAVRLWTSIMVSSARGQQMKSMSGLVAAPDPAYVRHLSTMVDDGFLYPRIHREDPWLRFPFDKNIVFESDEVAEQSRPLLDEALQIIHAWQPPLAREIELLDPDIQLVRDVCSAPDAIVSFSDNATPGCLYVSVRSASGYLDPYLIADSLIHEHRHQKLYLLQRHLPLFEFDGPLVRSPWRADLRPPSGLLHAVFVFVQLLEFWGHWAQHGDTAHLQVRGNKDCEVIRQRLSIAFPVLRGTRLTKAGRELTDVLEAVFDRNTAWPKQLPTEN